MSAQSIPRLDNTFGALLLGSFVATALYGLTSHQFFRYFRMYPGDPQRLKNMVVVLWLLDTIHLVFTMHACYYYLVTYFFQFEVLNIGVWSLRLTVTLTSAITMVTHLFFAQRIYQLSGHKWLLPFLITIIAVVRLGFGLGNTVVTFKTGTFAAFENHYSWLVIVALVTASLSDISIAVTLCYYLHSSSTGFMMSDTTLDRILIYTINTGLLTSILTIVDVICAATMPDNLIYLGLYFVISKLYTNSLMAVLNSRRSLFLSSQIGSFDMARKPPHSDGVLSFELTRRQSSKPVLDIRVTREVQMTTQDELNTSHSKPTGFSSEELEA